jgi:hypothetical protein
MGAETAVFFFHWKYSEVRANDWLWHVPGGIHYQTQDFRLKTFQNCNDEICGRAPELNAIRPDWFEYCFVDEEFVADREFGLASKYQYILVREIPIVYVSQKCVGAR